MQKITDPAALGAAIRACRKSSGLTQAQAAAVCGVGIRFLSELENGKATAHIGKVLKVISGLGLDLHLVPRSRDIASTRSTATGRTVKAQDAALKLETYKALINYAAESLPGAAIEETIRESTDELFNSWRNATAHSAERLPTASEQVAGLMEALFPPASNQKPDTHSDD